MANQGINFGALIYEPNFDVWAVDAFFNPIVSSPGSPTYQKRGIFDTRTLNVLAENNSIYSDQQTELDILEAEFSVLPKQGDHVTIPRDCNGVNQGEWVIVETYTNGGGETTCILRKWEP
jgi:flagellar basal body rod protein FlgG